MLLYKKNMTLENIIIWCVLGTIAGFIAGKITKGTSFGMIGNIIVGIIGSFIGAWLAKVLSISGAQVGQLSFASILTAVIGSVVFLFLLKFIK